MRLSFLKRQISLAISLLITFLLVYQVIYSLSILENTVSPEVYLSRISLALAALFFPILGGWLSFQLAGGAFFAVFAAVMVLFVGTITKSSIYIWFLLEYGILCFFLFRLDEFYENQIAGMSVDREKSQNERNALEISYKLKGDLPGDGGRNDRGS